MDAFRRASRVSTGDSERRIRTLGLRAVLGADASHVAIVPWKRSWEGQDSRDRRGCPPRDVRQPSPSQFKRRFGATQKCLKRVRMTGKSVKRKFGTTYVQNSRISGGIRV